MHSPKRKGKRNTAISINILLKLKRSTLPAETILGNLCSALNLALWYTSSVSYQLSKRLPTCVLMVFLLDSLTNCSPATSATYSVMTNAPYGCLQGKLAYCRRIFRLSFALLSSFFCAAVHVCSLSYRSSLLLLLSIFFILTNIKYKMNVQYLYTNFKLA